MVWCGMVAVAAVMMAVTAVLLLVVAVAMAVQGVAAVALWGVSFVAVALSLQVLQPCNW